MSSVGERLREERTRLGLTQQELGAACGVHRRAVVNYESDENYPGGAFLGAALRAGMDVHYVLSGSRNAALATDELGLLAAWRRANAQVRQMVSVMLSGMDDLAKPEGASAKKDQP